MSIVAICIHTGSGRGGREKRKEMEKRDDMPAFTSVLDVIPLNLQQFGQCIKDTS